MMGQQPRTESLFYYFRLQDQIPEDHLLRLIDRHIDFSFVRKQLKEFYSPTGRPSIDPEVLLRLLLVGYLYGITSERRLLEEVRMHLAYRWFTRLGFEQEIPDHSTFSKNRHGRFRQSGVFREVFEEIVRRCLEAGLVEGQNLAVDGTLVEANASRESRVPRMQLKEAAQISRTVREYLAELEQMNPVSDAKKVSTTDPDAILTTKGSGTARMAYYDNYLIDTASRVIVGVEATPALSRQEMVAARKMLERVEKLGVRPESLGADKAYGSGEFLAWLLARGVQPHIPVIDRRHQTGGHFTRDQFRYKPQENTYYCPEGKPLQPLEASRARLHLFLHRCAVPRLPTETALHGSSLSQSCRSLVRTSARSRPRSGRYFCLRSLAARPTQDRGHVLRTEVPHRPASCGGCGGYGM
jgi:transposase